MPNSEKKENNPNQKNKPVQYVTVENQQSGRRIDNFLKLQLKGVPKARIYQMLRKGEVRVNGSRIKQNQRIEEGDVVRIPPVSLRERQITGLPPKSLCQKLEKAILFEDEHLLVLNKPPGIPVHSGSGQNFGVIECLRHSRPNQPYLELAHRLDKDTSGCLILAKEADTLREIQSCLKNTDTRKQYLAFVRGHLHKKKIVVDQALKKGTMAGGERIVRINPEGKQAKTVFYEKSRYKMGSLLRVELLTGRTHQIRVHANYLDKPLAMDRKYGARDFNKTVKKMGLKRLFLHASEFELKLSCSKKPFHFKAPLPNDLQTFLEQIKKQNV